MENDTPILPQEIITSILVRLPVKSLIRFLCVCKDWKNLFRTPSFFAEHLHHSSRQNSLLLIVDSIIPEANSRHLYSLNREMQIHEIQKSRNIGHFKPGCVYSSNGLLCVGLDNECPDSLWLWNPTIRVVRQVPKSLNNYEYEDFSVGFGFSPTINDYKIIKLFLSGRFVVQGEVYSLKTGLWRKVEVGNLEGVYVLRGWSAFPCNETIFWMGRKDVEGHSKCRLHLIVSFDIAKDVFTLTPFPVMISRQKCCNTLVCYEKKLVCYENKLAIFFPNSESHGIDLWVLEECGDPSKGRWSWAKIFSSRPNPSSLIIYPQIIWRNEIVCLVQALPEYEVEEDYEGKLVLGSLTADELNIFDVPIRSFNTWIFDYVESLVLLDKIHI
ncbi:hypothetical protein QN277_027440 [Acacia crassicarpa]|uniref:F-box domain-containing protein n=1 Tax=Acacia crassicarpa TaxID=499986 RepID=A0AAE1K806_9FABA|nr:hypothetical protein QN277_027440 [Acacia crassicarpa]